MAIPKRLRINPPGASAFQVKTPPDLAPRKCLEAERSEETARAITGTPGLCAVWTSIASIENMKGFDDLLPSARCSV